MEEQKPQTPLRSKITIIILSISCAILAAALVLLFLAQYLKNNRSVSTIATLQSSIDELKEETIPIKTFKEHAQQYGASIPFLQSFFDDVIVYKNDNGIVYLPIDDSLPKNDYDFSMLTYNDGEIQYDHNGITALKGIDVSKYQGNIDWKAVKADGVSYAFIRAGLRGYGASGMISSDPYCEKNLKGASEAGVDIGVYFYSQAISKAEAIEEAEFVLDAIEGYEIKYPIVFDLEEVAAEGARTAGMTAQQITEVTIAFCERIKQAGYTPMIYGNIDWMAEHLILSELTEYDKWFAQYFNKPFFPYEFQIWQYTASGKVDGIKGNVDLNLCFKNYAE